MILQSKHCSLEHVFLGSFQTGCLVSVIQATRPVFPAGERIVEPINPLDGQCKYKMKMGFLQSKRVKL